MREAVATADTGRMRALLLTSDDSKRFPRTPIAALMDADSEAWRAFRPRPSMSRLHRDV